MKRSRILCLSALLLTAAVLLLARPPTGQPQALPGAPAPQRRLIRIWSLSSIGGGQAWLKTVLHRYEQAHPGVMIYLRQAAPEELTAPDAILPDLVLYMPGDVTDPAPFAPLQPSQPMDQTLLGCGVFRGQQLGLPLCWGGYVLAVDTTLQPGTAVTPAPTTLLGKPAPTDASAAASPTPGFPQEAAQQYGPGAVVCAPGVPLLALLSLLPEAGSLLAEPLPSQQQVYARCLAGQSPCAMLTTGQATALDGRIATGQMPVCRYLMPASVITDQIWLASLTRHADDAAVPLLSWLISPDAQRCLGSQGLQPACAALRLYAGGWQGQIASAGRTMTAVNAYRPAETTAQLAWQALQSGISLQDALRTLREDPAMPYSTAGAR